MSTATENLDKVLCHIIDDKFYILCDLNMNVKCGYQLMGDIMNFTGEISNSSTVVKIPNIQQFAQLKFVSSEPLTSIMRRFEYSDIKTCSKGKYIATRQCRAHIL